ncbi:glycosyltransferase family 2 protein [Dehalobacterium formicoaceticum]|uniref:glycosyltransferase family 2 protein n=1 Tax=Dehalobacterium formicoaceticum TaxID=51515 RepID=UPI001FA84589|nr:glycosyltransferase family 2 protein [Dehalobacterium formicoaceticum]
MLSFIEHFNVLIFLFFSVAYSYRIVYVLIGLYSKKKKRDALKPVKLHKYAVLIAARNEQAVIGELIKSLKNQKYPEELLDIFVVADNCTDQTAQRAREMGAIVYERFHRDLVGKGYALHFLFGKIAKQCGLKHYAGYFVFDADNLLEENYIAEMNRVFDKGYRVLTSYRNSKNYGHNWISAGYALWFLHEAEYLNNPRMILGKSCAISGTGFLVHQDIILRNGGWKHYLLTEDIEFSVSEVIKGETIGYCGSAVLYDEQPGTFKQAWNQRMRWAKGFYQVFHRYGKNLLQCSLQGKKQSFSCYDLMMTIMPALLLSITSFVVNGLFFLMGLINPNFGDQILQVTFIAILSSFGIYYTILFTLGTITTITEWHRIHCFAWQKIIYLFTFPLFMFTYVPIALAALFKKVEWKPIQHTCVKSLQDIREQQSA